MSGRFPLGSCQSRAAARVLLECRIAGRKKIDPVISIPRPAAEGEIRIGTRTEGEDEVFFRTSHLPPGMTMEEANELYLTGDGSPRSHPSAFVRRSSRNGEGNHGYCLPLRDA